MNRFFERHVEIVLNDNSQIHEATLDLDYYLLESERKRQIVKCIDEVSGNVITKNEICKSYGVEVVKRQAGAPDEKEGFEDVFQSKEKALKLVRMLADHTVTPSTLAYVLDDLIGI